MNPTQTTVVLEFRGEAEEGVILFSNYLVDDGRPPFEDISLAFSIERWADMDRPESLAVTIALK